MKYLKLPLLILFAALTIIAVASLSPAGATDDKYDGDCTDHASVGRCADKPTEGECPDGYFWRGGCVKVTGCPYGDSIPLGAECDKHKPAEPVAEPVSTLPTTNPVPDTELPEFRGK